MDEKVKDIDFYKTLKSNPSNKEDAFNKWKVAVKSIQLLSIAYSIPEDIIAQTVNIAFQGEATNH